MNRSKQPVSTAEKGEEVLERSFSVSPQGRCFVNVPRARIRMATSPQEQATVTVTATGDPNTAEAYVEELRLRVHYTEDVLRIEGGEPFQRGTDWWRKQRGPLPTLHIDVEVPVAFGAEVRVSGGAAHLSGLDGSVTLEATGGHVQAEDLGGRMELYAHRSDVELARMTGERMHLHVRGGTLSFRESDSEILNVETASSRVTLDDIEGLLQVTSRDDHMEVKNLRAPLQANIHGSFFSLAPDRGAEAHLHVPGSELELQLPSDFSANLSLSAAVLELGSAFSFDGERASGRAEGTIGDGGPLFEAHAPGGRIRCVQRSA